MSITINDNKVLNKNAVIYSFNFKISEFKTVDQKIIILLEPPINSVHNENIYCIDKLGKIIWQVEKTSHIYQDSPYDKIVINENNVLEGFNYDGCVYLIDINSGRIMDKKFLK